MLEPNDPIRVGFYGAAALFLAAAVAYIANAVAGQLASGRPLYFAFGYMTHRALRAVAVLAEIGGIVMFTWLTFAAGTDPSEPSAVATAIYRAAFGVEVLAILWAFARVVRGGRR